MTDLSSARGSVPSRLGVSTRLEAGELVLELRPQPETLHHGMVRASVLSFVIDVAAGIPLDQDPDVWTLTTDMSVRMRAEREPCRRIRFLASTHPGAGSARMRTDMSVVRVHTSGS